MRLMPLLVALTSPLFVTTLAAAQPTGSARPPLSGEPGPSLRLQSFSIMVPDYDEAKDLYGNTFVVVGPLTARDSAGR